MIDTPRTDEEEDACRECGLHFVPEEFARQLERELNAMTLRCQAADRTANAALAARPEERARNADRWSVFKDAGLVDIRITGQEFIGISDMDAWADARLGMNSGGDS